jgi:hypothetical protein
MVISSGCGSVNPSNGTKVIALQRLVCQIIKFFQNGCVIRTVKTVVFSGYAIEQSVDAMMRVSSAFSTHAHPTVTIQGMHVLFELVVCLPICRSSCGLVKLCTMYVDVFSLR